MDGTGADVSSAAPQAAPSLAELELGPETTLAQIVARWGEPSIGGPNGELRVYRIADGPPERELWLSFSEEEPRRLTRALIQTYPEGSVPQFSTIMNDLEATRSRRWSQLDFSRDVTAAEVYAAWGPPDNMFGWGMFYWTYRLADGDLATLQFEGDRVSRDVLPERAFSSAEP